MWKLFRKNSTAACARNRYQVPAIYKSLPCPCPGCEEEPSVLVSELGRWSNTALAFSPRTVHNKDVSDDDDDNDKDDVYQG
jgi:hypothetical protein